MSEPEPSDLDPDLRLRLSQPMLNQSLRPVPASQKTTLVTTGEEGPGGTHVMDEREQQQVQERDAATAGARLPKHMSGPQEWVLLPLSDAPEGVIGVGGEGVVYSYVQRELGREVAVKTLRADRWSHDAIESLLREACVTARLEHPNIVPVHYLHLPEYDGDSPYWVMKRVRGNPLTEHLPGGKAPWPFGKLLDVFRRVLDAVAFAHSKGIVHRDLKPDNVLVGEFGEVQVTDWGLAVAVNEEGARGAAPLLQDGEADTEDAQKDSPSDRADGERDRVLSDRLARLNDDVRSGRVGALLNTSAGGRAGTPAYMAPEQLRITAGCITERTDVFLLGGILYAMLTGQPPHQLTDGDDTDAARRRLKQIRSCSTIRPVTDVRRGHGLPDAPEDLSEAALASLWNITRKALSPEPGDRFDSAAALETALDEWGSRSTSQSLSSQAAARLSEMESQRRPSARGYAEVIALADASLEKWEANREARRVQDEASAALAAIQRRSSRRFWTAAAAITMVFVVGAIGYQRTQVQRMVAESMAQEMRSQRTLSARRLDAIYEHAYRRFCGIHDPVGRLLTAIGAHDDARKSGSQSVLLWGDRARYAALDCPRLVWTTPQRTHRTARRPLRFSPSGDTLACLTGEGGVCAWDVPTCQRIELPWSHAQPVADIAFDPDGELVVATTHGETIAISSGSSPKDGTRMPEQDYKARGARFGPRGRRLVSLDKMGNAVVWDTNSGETSLRRGLYRRVCFSRDGDTVALGGGDGTIKVIDCRTGSEKALARKGHTEPIVALAFAPGATLLASASRDREISLWDLDSGQVRGSMRGHRVSVNTLSFSADASIMASEARDHTVMLWDVERREEMGMLGEDASAVRCVSFSPRGDLMAVGAADGSIKLWDIGLKREQATLRACLDEVVDLEFSPDGSTLASASRDGTVRLWDLTPRQYELFSHKSTVGVRGIDLSPTDSILTWGGKDGIRLVDVPTGREIAALADDETPVYAVQFSPDGTAIAWGCGDGTTRLMDVWGGRKAATMGGHRGHTVYSVSLSRDGGTIVSTGVDGALRLWDTATKKELRTLREPQTGKAQFTPCKYCVAMSPDGRLVASGGGNGAVGLWDRVEGRLVRQLGRTATTSTIAIDADGSGSAPSHVVRSVAFHPDGGLLASAGDDAHITLWDPATGKVRARWEGHDDWIHSLTFNPTGDILASGGKDRVVRLWDVATQREIAALTGHTGSVGSVCFQSDGSALVSADYDGSIIVWHIPTGPVPSSQSAGRLTGSQLRWFDVVPLGKEYGTPERPMWSPRNPDHWLPSARQGDAAALCKLAIVLEKQGRDEEAQRLHRQAASSDGPGQQEWAQRSRWRLEHLPWLGAPVPGVDGKSGQTIK